MTDTMKIRLNKDSLTILLRSNLSCFMGRSITHELLNELTTQIIESLDYFINQNTEKK